MLLVIPGYYSCDTNDTTVNSPLNNSTTSLLLTLPNDDVSTAEVYMFMTMRIESDDVKI
jgi:hypothetical protein